MSKVNDHLEGRLYALLKQAREEERTLQTALGKLQRHGSDAVRFEVNCYNRTSTRCCRYRSNSPILLSIAMERSIKKFHRIWHEQPQRTHVVAIVNGYRIELEPQVITRFGRF